MKFRCFHYQFFIALFTFCAYPRVMETHLLTSSHSYFGCVKGRGGRIDLNIDSIDTKLSIGIGSILAWWDRYCSFSYVVFTLLKREECQHVTVPEQKPIILLSIWKQSQKGNPREGFVSRKPKVKVNCSLHFICAMEGIFCCDVDVVIYIFFYIAAFFVILHLWFFFLNLE